MRKFTILLALLLFIGMQSVLAQKKISGTVTSSEDGKGIPGATVLVKNTTNGVITDVDGKYTLNVKDGKILVFSFVGMTTKEVAIENQTVINVVLDPESKTLEGVVVTALGISREKKALGYSVQDVKGDELNRTRDINVMTSLSGKVSGIQITNASGNLGGSSRVTIRGISSITGNNQPLFVVDGIPFDNSDYNTTNTARGAGGYDYGNMAQDINPDDVESISVLKGPNAAALYGSRASNGVIVITTKKGKTTTGKVTTIGVKVNSSVNWNQVAILPKYQNLYGGGSILSGANGFDQVTINGKEYNIIDYATDESFGPKYDKNIQYLPAWSISDWEAKGKQGDLQTVPWTPPSKDVKDFFKTGVNLTNSFDVTGGNNVAAFRMGYTNVSEDGYMPNMQLKRNTLTFSGNTKLGDKLNAFAQITYVKNKTTGRPSTGYDDNNVMQKFNQWGQRSTDMGKMKDYMNADGSQRVWNRISWDNPSPMYSDNPYWTRYMNYQNDYRDRYFGNAGLTWDILPWLKLTGKVNEDYYSFRAEERVALGSQALSYYTESTREVTEMNSEFLFVADKSLTKDIHLNATFGGNMMSRTAYHNEGTTSGGLVLPNYFNLTNSVSPATTIDELFKKKINSLYGSASFAWKSMVYLDLTLRNDWSSTLPKNKWSYPYPSVTGSWVFTEMPTLRNNSIISFGKVRAGWAQVGNDTDPYRLMTLWTNYDNFGSDIRYSRPAQLNNPTLKPENTSSYEVGTELKFFNNRIGIDFSYYDKTSKNQIIPITISGASGYTTKVINAGELTNKGYEIMLNLVPIKMKDFVWNMSINYSHNENKVVSLAKGVSNLELGVAPFNATVNAMVGKSYGTIFGTDFIKDANGNIIVGTNGRYLATTTVKPIGNVMPKYNMGINNSFSYKGIDFSFLIDVQHGGQLFSTTYMWGMYSGILKESAATNELGNNIRDAVVKNEDGTYASTSGGVLLEGYYGKVNTDGTVQYLNADGTNSDVPVKNTTRIGGQRYCWDVYGRAQKQNIFSSDYIKLREIRIGYTIPSKYTGMIKNIRISAFGRNLAIWGQDLKHIDPENTTSSGNIQGIEGGALPSLRTFGLNLTFEF